MAYLDRERRRPRGCQTPCVQQHGAALELSERREGVRQGDPSYNGGGVAGRLLSLSLVQLACRGVVAALSAGVGGGELPRPAAVAAAGGAKGVGRGQPQGPAQE